MPRQCFRCKEWVDTDQPHDCWTTTEAALTGELSLDLREAWERLRETAADFGEQRIYASHHSIMFARKSCYFFVRPKRSYLEVCIFLGRPLNAPQVKHVVQTSKSKVAHLLRIRHRDEVEAPITDWIREAYEYNVVPASARASLAPKPAKVNAPKKARTKAAPRQKAAAKRSPAKRSTPAAKGVRKTGGSKNVKRAASVSSSRRD